MRQATYLFKLLILLLPMQLAFHLWTDWSYVYGVRIDYLSPTFYITDVVVLALFFVTLTNSQLKSELFNLLKKRQILVFLLLTLIILLISILTSPFGFISLYRSIKLLELLFVICISILLYPNVFSSLPNLLSIGVIWTSILSIAQLINNGSVGGLLYLLGERSFRGSYPGISTAVYLGSEHLRPYATFPHPNALAGFAGVVFLILLITKKRNFLTMIGLAASIIILGITVSQNAWLSLLFTVPFLSLAFRKRFLAFLLPILIVISMATVYESSELLKGSYISHESSVQRLELLAMSGVYLSGYPLTGIGLGNFIPLLPEVREFTSRFLARQFSWWLQPVHNIYVLILVEIGFAGLFLFLWPMQKLLVFARKPAFTIPLIFILLTAMWDHYWLTLQQTSLLFALVIGLLWKNAKIISDESSSQD